MATDTSESTGSPEAKTETVKVPEKKKSNKTLWIILGVVLFIFVVIPGLLLTIGGIFLKSKLGDQKSTDKTISSIVSKATDSKVNVNSSNGEFSVESKDGDSSISVGSNQKLPDGFPKSDIPYFAEKSITFAMSSKDEGKSRWSVTATSDKSFDDVKSYFAGKIKEPDYTDVSTYSFNDSQSYYGVGSKYTVSVTISKNSDEKDTNISYIVTEN